MTQEPKGASAPIGVVYNTSMARPDAALALSALYVSASRRESRMGAVCVTGGGLDAAIFCDIVGRFYAPNPGRAPSSNNVLPVGFPDVAPLPPSPPMVEAAVQRKKPNGEPQYARTIEKATDTAQPEAVLRNGITFNAESVVILSAPATWLARSLELAGTAAQYKQRVRRFVVVEAGAAGHDPDALRKVLSLCPAPVVFCGRDVGEALACPGAQIDSGFAWAPAHPVADAYRAFKPIPYDAPGDDLAAVHYALHPGSGFFDLSEPGTLSVAGDGAVSFTAGGGSVRRLGVAPATKTECLSALVALATSKPAPPQGRGAGSRAARFESPPCHN
jgi:hypothetical protein